MPLGPGGLDSNGIWQYGEDDSEALASDLLNLGMQSVSDALGAGFGKILQVVSTAKTDTFTTSSATFTPVTGLSATITPSATSSKILILAQVSHGMGNASGWGHFRLYGGNAGTYIGATPGNRVPGVFGGYSAANERESVIGASMMFLDSPATTSATTYGVEVRQALNNSVYINRANTDSDDASKNRGASSITLIEVAA